MYIEQAYKGLHEFWRYIVGSIIIISVVIAAQIPMVVAIAVKGGQDALASGDQAAIFRVLEPNVTLFFTLFPFLVGLICLFFLIRYLHKQKISEVTTARKKIDWKRIFFAFGLWAIVSATFIVIEYYTSPEDYVVNFKLVPFLILVVIAVILIPVQTSLEEYLFRGYLMQGFGVFFKNRWAALLLTSLIFGGLHFFNPEVDKIGKIIMIYYIGTGLFLGIITLMDEGMELALGFHAANNLIGALLISADWTVFQTHSVLKDLSEPEAGLDILIPVLVVFPILTLIFAKKYKWSGWKEKLFGDVNEPDNISQINTANTSNDL